jgi:hypothetical protein
MHGNGDDKNLIKNLEGYNTCIHCVYIEEYWYFELLYQS